MNLHHPHLSQAAWSQAALLKAGWMVVTALAAPVAILCAQTPGSIQQTTQTAATTTQFQATPEEIGDSLMAHQRYQAAIEQYKKASDSPDALNKMGVAYQLMFNLGDAERCYRMALKRDPKNAIALNNLGSIYVAQKEYSTAEHEYRKAVKLDPKSALFRKNLGTALLADHKYKKGWEAYQEALSLDPEIFVRSGSARVENPSSVQDRGAMNFYMAKGCVKAGLPQRAIYYLRLALNEGFTTPKKILADAELAALQDNPEFQQMMAAQGVYLHDPASTRPTVRQ
jgi:Flp pilus assembly protein TadD